MCNKVIRLIRGLSCIHPETIQIEDCNKEAGYTFRLLSAKSDLNEKQRKGDKKPEKEEGRLLRRIRKNTGGKENFRKLHSRV